MCIRDRLVAIDDTLGGAVEMHASVRPEAQRIIQQLRHYKVKSIHIISGDHETPTQKLAEALGVDGYSAEILPQHKADFIEQMQAEKKVVCYVGDGINDAIALKKADVSISLQGASSIAVDSAQVILMNGDLDQLIQLFEIAKDYHDNVKKTRRITFIPTIVTIGGVFFLHFGLIQSIILNQIGRIAGALNVTRPLIKFVKK